MRDDTILTLHPQGKRGRRIDLTTYDSFKIAITALLAQSPLTHRELFVALNARLIGSFAGNISWYGETVKLDLEARGIIVRIAARPVTYALAR